MSMPRARSLAAYVLLSFLSIVLTMSYPLSLQFQIFTSSRPLTCPPSTPCPHAARFCFSTQCRVHIPSPNLSASCFWLVPVPLSRSCRPRLNSLLAFAADFLASGHPDAHACSSSEGGRHRDHLHTQLLSSCSGQTWYLAHLGLDCIYLGLTLQHSPASRYLPPCFLQLSTCLTTSTLL